MHSKKPCPPWPRSRRGALHLLVAAGKSGRVSRKGALSRPRRTFHLAALPCSRPINTSTWVVLDAQLMWTSHFERLLRSARFAALQACRMLPRILQGAGGASLQVGGPHFSATRAIVMGAVYSRTYGCMFLSGHRCACRVCNPHRPTATAIPRPPPHRTHSQHPVECVVHRAG